MQGIAYRTEDFVAYRGRRSPVLSRHGMVASSHPLASQAGLEILRQGGNAADAAVACAAVLAVVEPMSTGLGGDCFALYWDAKNKTVFGMNGSGRAPALLTGATLRGSGVAGNALPPTSPHAVTVPGAAAGWADAVARFGRLSLAEVLRPAVRIAEEGFPVSPLVALHWALGVDKLQASRHGKDLLIDGAAPRPGQCFRNPKLAGVLGRLASEGRDGFYRGRVAEALVAVLAAQGGVLTAADLERHQTTWDAPIHTTYRGIEVFEMPPNGQGLTALLALNMLEGFDLASLDPEGFPYHHLLVESLRLAFADTRRFVADPAFVSVPVAGLLDKGYAARRRSLIDPEKATLRQTPGSPSRGSDTVYLAAADGEGNACSFINSLYEPFGTGIVPAGCGFALQNRGCNFSLDPRHPNALAPGKRPYHTIIPAMATRDGNLYACFGVMGGFLQPQGHVQVLLRMVEHGLDPQAALDAPRFCIEGGTPGGVLLLEETLLPATRQTLAARGHETRVVSGIGRSVFGRGQIIRRDPETGTLWGGSDPRADGAVAAA